MKGTIGKMISWNKGQASSKETKIKIRNVRRPQGYPKLINEKGEIHNIDVSLLDFCKKWNLYDRYLSRVINGHRKSHKGWRIYNE